MTESDTLILMGKLIEFMDENAIHMDGPYKVATLKTVASYYENITHAEGMLALIQKSFNLLN